MDLNNCDNCLIEYPSEDLVWIDSEDFEPLEADNFNPIKHKKIIELFGFSALCEDCYFKECCD